MVVSLCLVDPSEFPFVECNLLKTFCDSAGVFVVSGGSKGLFPQLQCLFVPTLSLSDIGDSLLGANRMMSIRRPVASPALIGFAEP